MPNKRIPDLQLRDEVSDDLNFPSDDGIQSYRVTGAQIKSYVLESGFTPIPPKTTMLDVGSGTFTPTGTPLYLEVVASAGGGGSSGSGTLGGFSGVAGGDTTFGTVISCTGGGRGQWAFNADAGGIGTINAGATGYACQGGYGQGGGGSGASSAIQAGCGGNNPLGGGGGGGWGVSTATPGRPNTGGGGGGAGAQNVSTGVSSTGGSAGGYVRAFVYPVDSSYNWVVGDGGAGGAAGTSGGTGGKGGSGVLFIIEHYQ